MTFNPGEFCCNTLMPMSGVGKRFLDDGFIVPKPYLDIFGRLIFEIAFTSLGFNGSSNIFIVREDHIIHRDIKHHINRTIHNSIVITEKSPQGQASSALQAKIYIDNDLPLFIVNCDAKIVWDTRDFLFRINEFAADAAIISFYDDNNNNKYSYVKVENGRVIETAEKKKISNYAMAGIYYFSKGSIFVKYAEKIISENNKINDEFYIAPMFNGMIQDNLNIINMLCMKITTLGTPEDVKKVLWERNV